MNPNAARPSNFSSVLLSDLSSGLNVPLSRLVLYENSIGPTSTSSSASVGTSFTFQVNPYEKDDSVNPSNLITPIQAYESIRTQFAEASVEGGVRGPLLQGVITNKLNIAFLVVLQLPASSLLSTSSTGFDSAAIGTAAPHGISIALLIAAATGAIVAMSAS